MPNCLNPMRQVIQAAQSVMMRVAQLMRSVRMRLRCQRSHRHGCHGGGGSTSPGRLRLSQAVRPASSRSQAPACIASGHATRQRHHGSPERCLGDGRYCARGLGHGHASCRTKSTEGRLSRNRASVPVVQARSVARGDMRSVHPVRCRRDFAYAEAQGVTSALNGVIRCDARPRAA